MRICKPVTLVLALGLMAASSANTAGAKPVRAFRAGAYAMDVSPTNLPVIINGGFLSQTATKVNQPLHVRWLVLDDGRTRVALGVLDTCIIPSAFADTVRSRAHKLTGIPRDHIMLSATHTHSAPSLMPALGTDADPNYPAFALPRIVEGLQRAAANLRPARVGWGVAQAPDQTHTRIWIRRPDKMLTDPFGEVSVRANMHPGYQNPDTIGPSGPSDPALTVLAVQSSEGRPIAVLANYSMHYFGAAPVSADYYGLFAEKLGPMLGAKEESPAFVGIMSQGTSGDQHWMDYGKPRRDVTIDQYASGLAEVAADACKRIEFHEWVPLAMREKTLRLATRQPDAKRLAWAQDIVAKMNGRGPKTIPEAYAGEQLWLKENPKREVVVQALRVGDLGVAIWPCEVFAISGLKIKALSPLQPTMNIELANSEEGYIPPPELHPLGGYNTWACRTAGLEATAEPKLVDALLDLLEKVSDKPRRKLESANGRYAQAVLDSKPLAYWRLDDWSGPIAMDTSGAGRTATYEPGVARWLDGPAGAAFSGEGVINRCPHFAGNRVTATLKPLADSYTAELWFWNGLPNEARGVTGYMFGRGDEWLALNGTNGLPGTLAFGMLVGRTVIRPKTWNHVGLVREGSRVSVYLNGTDVPEITGEAAPDKSRKLFVGGRSDKQDTIEGRIDEVAIYARPLSAQEIQRHFRISHITGTETLSSLH